MPKMSLTEKLKAAKSSGQVSAPHIIVEALAGTGKTTTLIEALKILKGKTSLLIPSPQQKAVWDAVAQSSPESTVAFVAFNKSIATELQERVPQGVDAMTNHALGNKAVAAAFGRVRLNEYRVSDIIGEILGVNMRDFRKDNFVFIKAVTDLVGLVKMNLAETDSETLSSLASYYEIDLNHSANKVFDLVPKVIERCKDVKKDGCMDFNDMIWLPVALNLPVARYDLLLIDEAQDLNRCQQALVKKAGKRLVFCGDKNQAIYGFAGADAESLDRLYMELSQTEQGCEKLPLTVTRRCGKKIVEEARAIVPTFEAHPSNGEGQISNGVYDHEDPSKTYHNLVEDKDMIVCRVNGPLVSQCFKFIKAGRKANIQGRDVGQGLISTIKKLMGKEDLDAEYSIVEFISRLSDWKSAEETKENAKRNPSDARLIQIQDKYDCLMCFTEEASRVQEVISKIEQIFTDSQKGGIRLSSIHKAKGLEANRVFLIEPGMSTVPHPMAKSAWQKKQEWNCRYIALTRAIKELVYVK